MKQKERREYLINGLIEENPMLGGLTVPQDEEQQKELLKTLIALREPCGATLDFMLIQDEYLKEEITANIVETDGKVTFTTASPISIKADSLVHFADNSLLGSFTPGDASLDSELHFHAGIQLRLQAADITQKDRGLLKAGEIRVTPAFNLAYESIIHAVGPTISREVKDSDREALKSLMYGVIETAEELGSKTVVLTPYSRRYRKFDSIDSISIMLDAIKSYPENEIEFIISGLTDSELERAKGLLATH